VTDRARVVPDAMYVLLRVLCGWVWMEDLLKYCRLSQSLTFPRLLNVKPWPKPKQSESKAGEMESRVLYLIVMCT
jgi:hypothetical protein